MTTRTASMLAALLSGLALFSTIAAGAASGESGASQIAVAGSSSIDLVPDSARFSVMVTSVAATSSAAGEETARITRAVRAALAGTALKPSDIKNETVAVGPRWEYSDSRRPRRSAYEATSTIAVETKNLGALGAVVDAALAAGATDISSIDFDSSGARDARDEALRKAAQSARRDAEVLARANGGRLGRLLLMTTLEGSIGPANMEQIVLTASRKREAVAAPTNIDPPDVQVSARVEARWEFLPDESAR